MTGEYMHNIKLNYPAYKDISLMVPIPKQPFLIGLIDSEKGTVMNVSDRKVREMMVVFVLLLSIDSIRSI